MFDSTEVCHVKGAVRLIRHILRYFIIAPKEYRNFNSFFTHLFKGLEKVARHANPQICRMFLPFQLRYSTTPYHLILPFLTLSFLVSDGSCGT